jgi:outer membrane biosynthesis protein TonB
MKLSKRLEEAVFIHSDDDLLDVLSEDVIHDMRVGDFSTETVEEALTGIFASYVLTEEDASVVNEAIDELGESMGLDEGFLDWLKGAAKSALKAVGQAALGAAKEGGKQAISTSAAELKKRIKAKEKKEPAEPPQPKGVDKEEPEDKPKKKPKKKAPKKVDPEEKPEEEPEGDPKEPKAKSAKKAKPKSAKKAKPKAKAKEEPKADDDDEESGDIKQNLKDIASKALGKIANDPEKAKEILKKHGKKAAKALAKHGVKKGMKMVFGRWIKDKGGSKKEWTTGNVEMDSAVQWLVSEAEVHPLADGTVAYDYEGEVPTWVTEALNFGVDGTQFSWSGKGRRLSFDPGETSTFMMVEAKKSESLLDQIKKELLANDPATYGDYGEYELSGSLKERVEEIIYNHAYEAASRYGPDNPASMRRALNKTLFALAKREGFKSAAEKSWKLGLKDGAGA